MALAACQPSRKAALLSPLTSPFSLGSPSPHTVPPRTSLRPTCSVVTLRRRPRPAGSASPPGQRTSGTKNTDERAANVPSYAGCSTTCAGESAVRASSVRCASGGASANARSSGAFAVRAVTWKTPCVPEVAFE